MRPRARPGPRARFAVDDGRHPDGDRVARHRPFEVELEGIAKVRSPVRARPPTAARPEDVPEDVVEDIAKAAAEAAPTEGVDIDPVVAELVVGGPLLRIGEDLVGFLGLLEAILRLRVVGVAVRVVLHREAAVGLLQRVLVRAPLDSEHLVVVALGHRSRRLPQPPATSADIRVTQGRAAAPDRRTDPGGSGRRSPQGRLRSRNQGATSCRRRLPRTPRRPRRRPGRRLPQRRTRHRPRSVPPPSGPSGRPVPRACRRAR